MEDLQTFEHIFGDALRLTGFWPRNIEPGFRSYQTMSGIYPMHVGDIDRRSSFTSAHVGYGSWHVYRSNHRAYPDRKAV